ncbi:MAG: hypothetical protein HS111_03030 [Kofleriaceae bacterium]|nr:hypothetical protein [Kofleriaceae bacterium]
MALAGVNDDELAALCRFAWARSVVMRFIEHMPLSSGALSTIAAASCRRSPSGTTSRPTRSARSSRPHRERGIAGPARYWRLVDAPAREVGIISAMTEHFCDRLQPRPPHRRRPAPSCLGHDAAVNLRDVVRAGSSDDDLARAIAWSVHGKREGHEFQRSGGGAPTKHMIAMGG